MKPFKATIRSYQVGFGDCFLLSFHYKKAAGEDEERHVLIDCGSTAPPVAYQRGGKTFSLVPVAQEIAKVCKGKLTAVVATHRHKDHISGFATSSNGKGSGDVLAALKPDLVLQPWTEDPKLPKNARSPKGIRAGGKMRLSAQYALGLQGMHKFCEGLLTELGRLKGALGVRLQDQLNFLGDDNLSNLSAVENLMGMAKNEYLNYRRKTKLEELLPGVTITVLGPPTLEQNEGISKQRSKDAAEFWHLRGAAAASYAATSKSPFAQKHQVTAVPFPPEVRWIIPRIQASRGAQLLELVRILDDQMNNTSLILLFQVGKKSLLFPGDAQIENWTHALKDAPEADANRLLLAEADFYKVGHHGSLNATPKTLWELFNKRATTNKAATLKTMMSTRAGKHGDVASKTEVPRQTLVAELKSRSILLSTEDVAGTKVGCQVATLDL